MTTTAQRHDIISLITQACQSGARLHKACKQIGMTCRTLQRWLRPCSPQQHNVSVPVVARRADQPSSVASVTTEALPTSASQKPLCEDRRQSSLRQAVTPHNKLTQQECDAVLAVINSEEFKDLPPSQIVSRLADQGCYLASESTMHRLLRCQHQNAHRRSQRPAQKRRKPFALKAMVVNQVFTWDITYLPTTIKGRYFYLYVFCRYFLRCRAPSSPWPTRPAVGPVPFVPDLQACHLHP